MEKKVNEGTYILIIRREPVVDACGEDDQVILHQPNAHPLVLLPTDIKVSLAITDVPDLLILVEMLSEEHLHLGLVGLAHCGGRNDDLVAVLVAAFFSKRIDACDIREMVIDDAEGSEVIL